MRATISLLWLLSACNALSAPLPPGVPDPNSLKNAQGAQLVYEGALLAQRDGVAGKSDAYIPVSGLLTDELESGEIGLPSSVSTGTLMDSRVLPEYTGTGSDNVTNPFATSAYAYLQATRATARQARGYLLAYAPQAPKALTGHMYAVEGYADVLLADLFCSGIPLSTVDFNKDFTYAAGSSTQQVYEAAIVYFDSALALVADSARFLNFARVGKGRALLALGQYANAAAAVASVPDGYQYLLAFSATTSPGFNPGIPVVNYNFAMPDFTQVGTLIASMVDRQGQNGLPYLSSGDPRSAWEPDGANGYGIPMVRPLKYDSTGDSSIVLASGVEARLIMAEAQLQGGGGAWLGTLNTLRTDGTFTTQQDTINPSQTDTIWNPGTGGMAGLAPLVDPGDANDRVSMLFSERAYWLFLTGHRQGDLRRLIRQYGRSQSQVYPVGPYAGARNQFGTDVTLPVPGSERIGNPRFKGCQSRGA